MKTYEPIDRPVRMKISLESMTFMLSERKTLQIYMYCYVAQTKFGWRTVRQCLSNYAWFVPLQRRPLCLKYLAVTQVTNVGHKITSLSVYKHLVTDNLREYNPGL